MHLAFLIVALVLFALDAFLYWYPNQAWGGRLLPLGLAFLTASFIPGLG